MGRSQSNPFESIPSLRLLSAATRKGSLAEAAASLGLTPSSASHALARMKKAFGDPLFLRTERGIAPTAAMKSLLPRIEAILDAVDSLGKPQGFDPGRVTRSIRFLTYDLGYLAFILPVTYRFQREAPGMRISIDFLQGREHAENDLRLGKADFCINPGLSGATDIVSLPLGTIEYRLMVRKGHPLEAEFRRIGTLSIDSVSRLPPFIPCHRQGGYSRPWLEAVSHGAPSVACNYFNVAPFVLRKSDAVEWIPDQLADDWSETGLFTIIPLRGRNRSVFTTRLFWAARDERDPLNQWIRSVILSAARERPEEKARKSENKELKLD